VKELLPSVLNVHGTNDLWQPLILVPEPLCFEAQIANAKLKKYTFPGTNQISTE
jgi:hypothetical protein